MNLRFIFKLLALTSTLAGCYSAPNKNAALGENSSQKSAATSRSANKRSSVSGANLKTTSLQLLSADFGDYSSLAIVASGDEEAEYFEFYACDQQNICNPSKEKPARFALYNHVFPNPPAGTLEVGVRSCVHPEDAIDESKNCGEWLSMPYHQKTNTNQILADLLLQKYQQENKIKALAGDIQTALHAYLSAIAGVSNPDETTQKLTRLVQNQVLLGGDIVGEFLASVSFSEFENRYLNANLAAQLNPSAAASSASSASLGLLDAQSSSSSSSSSSDSSSSSSTSSTSPPSGYLTHDQAFYVLLATAGFGALATGYIVADTYLEMQKLQKQLRDLSVAIDSNTLQQNETLYEKEEAFKTDIAAQKDTIEHGSLSPDEKRAKIAELENKSKAGINEFVEERVNLEASGAELSANHLKIKSDLAEVRFRGIAFGAAMAALTLGTAVLAALFGNGNLKLVDVSSPSDTLFASLSSIYDTLTQERAALFKIDQAIVDNSRN